MNEAAWLASDDSAAMLRHLTANDYLSNIKRQSGPTASDRKLRLFACACCRAVWDGAECPRCGQWARGGYLKCDWNVDPSGWTMCSDCHGTGRVGSLTDPRSRRAVEVAERYADGEATLKELDAANLDARRCWSAEDNAAGLAVLCSHSHIVNAIRITREDIIDVPPPVLQAALLRDVFGNPFRPMTLAWHDGELCRVTYGQHGFHPPTPYCDPVDWLRWSDGAIPRIAAGIYADRAFGRLPILADALTDAGCDDEGILAHCRGIERGEFEGPPVLATADECPYCKHWPADSPRGENGYVKCHRWRAQPSFGAEYGDPGRPILNRCGKCNRVWEAGYDQVTVITRTRPAGPHVRGCWALDLILGNS